MSVIIGRCEHGKVVAAATEEASYDTLTEMACSYALERVETASFDGTCDPCQVRYLANMKLLGLAP